MSKRLIVSPLLIVLPLLLSAPVEAHAPTATTIPFKELLRGAFRACEIPCYFAIKDQAHWQRFWDKAVAGYVPKPSLPQIDFSNRLVVVVGMGSVGSSGYTIAVTKVSLAGPRFQVLVHQDAPTDGAQFHVEFPYQVVEVATQPRQPEFTVQFSHMVCTEPEGVFCGVPPWNGTVRMGGKCGTYLSFHSTCYTPAQRTRAERTFPVTPFDPSSIILGQTHLRLTRLVVESQPNITNTARVLYAIHYIYGRLPSSWLVPVQDAGGRRAVIPVFSISPAPRFLDVSEYWASALGRDVSRVRGTWLQQNSAPFTRTDTNEPIEWHGPWQFTAAIRPQVILVVRSYTKPSILRVLGIRIRAAATG